MAYFTIRGSRTGAMFTIPCDNAEAVCTKPVDQASTSSTNSQGGPARSSDSASSEGNLSISLKFLDDDCNLDAYPSPNPVPSTPALQALYTGADTDITTTSGVFAVPPSQYSETAWSGSTAVSLEAPRESASRVRTGTMPQIVLQPGENSAGLTNTAPVQRAKLKDNGRLKGLLKARGLSIRTQGLETYYTFSQLFQPGGDVRCNCAY